LTPTLLHGPLDDSRPAEGLVLMLHGSGDSAEGMHFIAEMWAQRMPRVAFVMPSAPVRGQMSAWFGKRARTKENPGHLCINYATVERQLLELLEVERKRLGLRWDQVGLWGFSAGSLMAAWLSLLLPEACGALVLLHGLAPDKRLPMPPSQSASAGAAEVGGPRRPPALVLAGGDDVQVPAVAVAQAAEELRSRWRFPEVTYVETPGQDHSIGDGEYEAMFDFLAGHLCKASEMYDQPGLVSTEAGSAAR